MPGAYSYSGEVVGGTVVGGSVVGGCVVGGCVVGGAVVGGTVVVPYVYHQEVQAAGDVANVAAPNSYDEV